MIAFQLAFTLFSLLLSVHLTPHCGGTATNVLVISNAWSQLGHVVMLQAPPFLC